MRGGRVISAATSSSSGRTRLATHGRRPRARLAAQVDARDRDPGHAVGRRVLARRLDRRPASTSQASTGSKPSRAAAIASTPVPQPQSASAPAGLELEQQLEAQARRVVRAGAERLAGVDHEVDAVAVERRLPRRPHAQPPEAPAHVDRPVERLPALRPVVGDLARGDVDERVAGGGAQVGQRGQLARARRRARTRPRPRRARAPRARRARARAAPRAPPRRRRARRGSRAGSRRAPGSTRAPTRPARGAPLAQAVARERRRDLVGARRQHARGDQPLGRALEPAAAIACSSRA